MVEVYPKTAIKWWVSSNKITCFVVTNNNKVIATCTVLRKFVGQDFGNLKQWLHKQGGLRVRVLRTK